MNDVVYEVKINSAAPSGEGVAVSYSLNNSAGVIILTDSVVLSGESCDSISARSERLCLEILKTHLAGYLNEIDRQLQRY